MTTPEAPLRERPDAESRGKGEPAPAPWGLALDLGLRLGISVVLGVVLGLFLDGWLHTRPLFILLGAALGFAAAMYTVWQIGRANMRK